MGIFEFFFKYKPIVYQKGRLAFQLPWINSKWWLIPVAIAAIAAAVYFYRNVAKEKRSPAFVVLRALTFIVLLFIFLRPVLNVSTVLPQDSYLAVVIDNSQSMNIKDDGVKSRGEELQKQLEDTKFFKRLKDKFKVRTYRFDRDAERIDENLTRVNFGGTRTRVESATDLLHQELGTVPLSGVVLITDGVDNASQQLQESIARLESRHIPFYTVGVGSDRILRDAEVVKVVAPREMLKESTAVVDVSFRSHGFSGKKGSLYVRENGMLIKTEEIVMPPDGEIFEKSVDLPVKNEGNRIFSFSIQVQDDRIAENNTLDSLITIRNDHPQILYIEGEPRWEYKFLRQAVQDDPNLHLVSFLRTSQNKFYRQGVEGEESLKEGFPKKKEELYAYKGLIFGSIESTFFSKDQLDMVVDFVNNRGGGFLMTGGRNSFSAGRYQNSPIADILPVQLTADKTPVLEKLKLMVTEYGKTHTLMRLSSDASANVKQWAELPALVDFNKTLEAKAGGIVLARGLPEGGSDSPILLAFQRYGRGRAMAFTSSTSWHWQMQMDSKDQTHEMFWKQILRWLVNSSPNPVMVASDKDTYLPGDAVKIDADVSDKSFKRLNNARVAIKVTDPRGTVQNLPLDWSGAQDGLYQTQINAGSEGMYQVEVDASQGDQNLGSYKTAFQVKDRPVEFYDAALDSNNLKSIAQETGGKYYPLSKIGDVPEDAQYVEGETSFTEQKELWDVPVLFMLLAVTLASEWFWRKKKGLA
jgi:uncharacterized membrane protein